MIHHSDSKLILKETWTNYNKWHKSHPKPRSINVIIFTIALTAIPSNKRDQKPAPHFLKSCIFSRTLMKQPVKDAFIFGVFPWLVMVLAVAFGNVGSAETGIVKLPRSV